MWLIVCFVKKAGLDTIPSPEVRIQPPNHAPATTTDHGYDVQRLRPFLFKVKGNGSYFVLSK